MKQVVRDHDMPRQRLTRIGMLVILAAAIVGIGCATITVPAPKDVTGETVYLPAAKKGDAMKQLQLALAYRYGTAGLQQSNADAVMWLEKSANAGNVEAEMMLGDAYIGGDMGLGKQPALGLTWLRKSVSTGSPNAQFHLATLLDKGRLVPADQAEAAVLYERAARNGRLFAAWRLAGLYERGQGVRPDPVEAYAWYRIANSAADADRLRQRLTSGEQKKAEHRLAALNAEIQK
jgi:TPR repeat protein